MHSVPSVCPECGAENEYSAYTSAEELAIAEDDSSRDPTDAHLGEVIADLKSRENLDSICQESFERTIRCKNCQCEYVLEDSKNFADIKKQLHI